MLEQGDANDFMPTTWFGSLALWWPNESPHLHPELDAALAQLPLSAADDHPQGRL
ncbi:MAG: hypothetical protein ACLS63_07495 [Flavonifractor plautii]